MPTRKYPDPVLLTPAAPVDIEALEDTDELLPIFQEMLETMQAEGGVGIAAPQIGVSRCMIIVAETQESIRFLMNPKITRRSGVKAWSTERCLSCGNVTKQIKRDVSITVEAIDAVTLEPVTIKARDHLAAVYAHEIDHLRGITLMNRPSK